MIHHKPGIRRFSAIITLFTTFFLSNFGGSRRCSAEPAENIAPKPKLVLVIIVDQMRGDYLERFQDLFSEKGFRLLMDRGANFSECAYDHASTYTGPGHSVILSGIPVGRSGIIGNEWYDRKLQRNRYCVEDSSVRSVGTDADNPAGRMSPLSFLGSTLGDQLIDSSPGSRVVGIALKDRGAILPSGKHPTGAYWFDPKSGKWISSSYYSPVLPSWVEDFNNRDIAEGYLGKSWTRLLPASDYARQGADDARGEGSLPGELGRVFPHVVHDLARRGSTLGPSSKSPRRFDALLPTPFGDELTTRFAEAAIEGDSLGRRNVTDLLSVSFSSPDYCGHIFGPDSHEIEDMLVRLDRQLESLFAFVDRQVGLENVLIVLTADHGVCPLPEQSRVRGASRVNDKDLLLSAKVLLGQSFNYNEGNDNLILAFTNGAFYLDSAAIHAHRFILSAFEFTLIKTVSNLEPFAYHWTRNELANPRANNSTARNLEPYFEHSFNPERSGDVGFLPPEYSFYSTDTVGTTHGSPFYYDQHVPLILSGPRIRPGQYRIECRPNDITPTLASLLGLTPPPGCDGKVLQIAVEGYNASLIRETIPPR